MLLSIVYPSDNPPPQRQVQGGEVPDARLTIV